MFKSIQELNAIKKLTILAPFFKKGENVLDFGCGDLLLDRELLRFNKNLKITGVDVVNFECTSRGLKFYTYNGKRLPFEDKSFDTVLAFHALHHCINPLQSFNECLRVTKKRLIIVEPIYRVKWEIPLMRFMDWIYNVWKSKSIDMRYKFLSKNEWLKIFNESNLKMQKVIDIEKHPFWIPIGRGYLFYLERSE